MPANPPDVLTDEEMAQLIASQPQTLTDEDIARQTHTGTTVYDEQPSAMNEFASGVGEKIWPGWDFIKRLGAATREPGPFSADIDPATGKPSIRLSAGVQLGGDIAKGLWESGRDQATKAWDALQRAKAESLRGDYVQSGLSATEAMGHGTAAAVPGIGPAAAETGEDLAEGRTAHGAGGVVGMLAPFVAPKLIAGTAASRAGAASAAEEGAARNMVKAIGATAKEVPSVGENARYLSEKTGVSASKPSMLRKITGKTGVVIPSEVDPESLLGQAYANLDRVKQAGAEIPVNFKALAEQLEGRLKKIEYPEGRVGGPPSVDPALVSAFNRWAERLRGVAEGNAEIIETPGAPRLVESSIRGPKGEAIFDEVEGPPVKTKVSHLGTADQLFTVREQAGKAGARGQGFIKSRQPGATPTPSGEAGVAAHGVLSEEAKALVPGLVKADLDVHALRQAADILERSAQAESVGRAGAAKTMLGRLALHGTVGSAATAAGFMAGGAPGAAAGGLSYGAFQVAREILGSTWWNTLSAAQKLKFADLMRSGTMPTLGMLGEAATGASTALPSPLKSHESTVE